MIFPPETSTVDISNIINQALLSAGLFILSTIALWTRNHLNNKQAQQTVLTAAENAVAYAENRLGVKGSEPYTVPVASAIGRLALGYMNAHVGDAVKQMGLDQAGISRIIVAKMPDIKDGGIDQGTFNSIAASASGKAPPPADYSALLQVLGPAIEQAASKAISDHYAAKPTTVAKPIVVDEPAGAGKSGVG
jgi:hypothetical protein